MKIMGIYNSMIETIKTSSSQKIYILFLDRRGNYN